VSTNLTQLFARLIVCAVFLPTGAHHLFRFDSFSADETKRIERMSERLEKQVESAKPMKKVSLRTPAEDEPTARDPNSFRGLNRVALRLDDAHVPQPLVIAWAVAIAEFAGSLALLVGIFTRWFTPVLALIGAFTLWKGVWPEIGGAMPWTWSNPQTQLVVTWLAGTLLPISVFLNGPGKPSIEAAMKGGKGAAKKPPAGD
jgi:uncharacterized membrane protein YphA (DoxX/SURF4 family)